MKRTAIRIGTKLYGLTDTHVKAVLRRATPTFIRLYYINVHGKHFPPKQVIRLATKTKKPFGPAKARRALTDLGFEIKRVDS